jgi:hypothetical protein
MTFFLDNLMEEDDIVIELDLLASNIKKYTCLYCFRLFIYLMKTKHAIYAYIDVR